MNDVKELKDEELKHVAGGDNEFVFPNVIDKFVEDAKSELEELGFSCSVQLVNSSKPIDTVIDTIPTPGSNIEPPFEVVLFVSSGKTRLL